MNKHDNYVHCAVVLEEGECFLKRESETVCFTYFAYKLFLLCVKEIKLKQVQGSLRS